MVGLEVCVDSIDGAEAAVRGGADRIELCSALSEGGLTPSYGLMQSAASLPVPCHAMIRPKAGNFRFSTNDVQIMIADIDAVHKAGLAGVVLGAQGADGGLDVPILTRLTERATGLSKTLHRVVDVVDDPLLALDDAIHLHFDRILTSGGHAKAIDGALTIAEMVARAANRITVMAGSGLCADNISSVLAAGVPEVHASCSHSDFQVDALESLNNNSAIVSTTSEQKVRALRTAIDRYSQRSG